ncbi:MAG: phage major capsid protein [Candidatus Dormiibacter spiritus]|nr:MAG: phage major capsid protein [Candidatus Dormibacteraeota bacterium]
MGVTNRETNQVLIPKGSGAASVGIVSENTAKPSADQTYTQVTVNIFTAAGISKQSKQLAMDSSPTVLDLSTRELGTLLGNLEEQKALNGSGTGEPRGILNVTGIGSQTVTGGAGTQNAVLDALMDAVVFIETNYFAPPSGILMHPRRLAWLLKGKDSALNYIFNPAATFRQPNMAPLVNNNVTSMSTGISQPPASLFGIPIATTANMPTNLGAGTNEDRIVVGAFNEAHWFQRQDVTMDVSDSAGTSWEQNQVWIRAEERFGFSAERYPVAFSVLSGTCLLQT